MALHMLGWCMTTVESQLMTYILVCHDGICINRPAERGDRGYFCPRAPTCFVVWGSHAYIANEKMLYN